MKALLVANDERAINNISEVLKSAGYDTIVYKWFLKAIDNLEEISPHLLIISTKDYPRHWKILVQYTSAGFGNYTPQTILYVDEHFNADEKKKAEFLKVRGYFNSVDVDGLDKLRSLISNGNDIFAQAYEKSAVVEDSKIITVESIISEPYDKANATVLPGTEELKKLLNENSFTPDETDAIIENTEKGDNNMADEQSIDEKLAAIMNANKADAKEKAEALKIDTPKASNVTFVFTNPITLAMVSGVTRNYNGLVLEFTPEIPSFILNLSHGTKIDIASIKIDGKIENVYAEVMSNDTKKMALAIKKIS